MPNIMFPSRSLSRTLLISFVLMFIAVFCGLKYHAAQINPNFTQRVTLTASDGASADEFGGEGGIAISGETAFIGARRNNGGKGAVYVFVRSGSGWTQQAKLTANDGVAGDEFGFSVAISGETLLVGAPRTTNNRGSVYIFTLNGTSWTQQAKLVASDGAVGDLFGWSISVEGTSAIIGSTFADVAGKSNQGAAYLFERLATGWVEQQKLTAADGSQEDFFGRDVALSGNTVVVGAERHDVGTRIDQGAAYVYVRTGNAWS